jgi:endonuclease YncB( thermonuclease family)
MARAIWKTSGSTPFLAGTFGPGFHGDHPGSVRQIVHDGDTISVAAKGNFSVRLLGIDTPEVSYHIPGNSERFVSPDKPELAAVLANPFDPSHGPIADLSAALRDHIADRADREAGANHADLAQQAHHAFEDIVQKDAVDFGWTTETMSFFLAFAYEALDGYGRLLCYVHPDQPNAERGERRLSYNERMLGTGLAAPYFIFPNVDPFRSQGSLLKSAEEAQSPQTILRKARRLRDARNAVKAARAAHDGRGSGIFDRDNPLLFQAFELRFLADRRAPVRWIIDLSGDDKLLHHPQTYPDIPLEEDRLWVPEEFVPLFEAAGWRRGPTPSDIA